MMKTLIAAVFALSTIAAEARNKPMKETYNVDSAASKITYLGKKVTGSHTGNVTVKSGNLLFSGAELSGGEIVVDMNSITSTDITDADTNGKYVGHMKSPDFFDTAKHPEAKLVIKKTKSNAQGLEVNGDLTMLGNTQPVKFQVTDWSKTDSTVVGKATLKLDRTKWGLKYGSSSFFKSLGDKAIENDFTLDVVLSAKK
jgi:polyisoprenoid-binding protein YceI